MSSPAPLPYLRPVAERDLEQLYGLADSVTGTLTTLPRNRAALEDKIHLSLRAFYPRIKEPHGEHYLLVLDDGRGGLLGTAGLGARIGGFEPFYSYTVKPEPVRYAPLGVEGTTPVLHLRASYRGPAELCTLFLHPRGRSGGLGRLLSLSRFHLVGAFPERFDRYALAEMRGWSDATGRSPFWEAVCRPFFQMDFERADLLSGTEATKDFIAALMPRHPVYLAMLPEAARAIVGRVHPETEAALRLLLDEGFAPNGDVDIFDAGPHVMAELAQVRCLRERQMATVGAMLDDAAGAPAAGPAPFVVANTRIDFRACLGDVTRRDDGTVALARPVAEALAVAPGDTVGWFRARAPKPTATPAA